MRLIFGMILGAGLTIGAAYVHDTKVTGPSADERRLVNWALAGTMTRNAYDAARAQFEEWTGY